VLDLSHNGDSQTHGPRTFSFSAIASKASGNNSLNP
jgi:hypothetical protein